MQEFDSINASNIRLGFQRTGASDEMDLTYGGKHWIQNGAAGWEIVGEPVSGGSSNIGETSVSGAVEIVQ